MGRQTVFIRNACSWKCRGRVVALDAISAGPATRITTRLFQGREAILRLALRARHMTCAFGEHDVFVKWVILMGLRAWEYGCRVGHGQTSSMLVLNQTKTLLSISCIGFPKT